MSRASGLTKGTGLTHADVTKQPAEERPVSNLKLLSKILRVKGIKVTAFTFQDRGRELHLTVKPHKNGCRCPQCGRRGRIVASAGTGRSWEDLTVLGIKIFM